MPETIVVSPFAIRYDGKDADQHVISSRHLGHSVIGASQLYTAVAHYCMFGTIPRGNYRKQFECYASPAHERCFEYHVLIAAIGSEWVLHGPIYKEGLSLLFSKVVDAIKKIWIQPGEVTRVVEKLAETLNEQARSSEAIQTLLANGLIRANDKLAALHGKLIDTMPEIASVTRSPGTRLVSPVGPSCTSMTQFSGTPDASTITEAEAEVIRGTDMEIEDMREFRCKNITEVNTVSGHCILQVEDFKNPIMGKISDPALQQPNNVYTKALNEKTAIVVSAKPVNKGGVLHKLFISDAKAL